MLANDFLKSPQRLTRTYDSGAVAVLARSKRDLAIAAIVVFCVSVGLYLDGDCTRIEQYFLGAIAWCFLFGLLQFETPAIRMQVGVAVAVATLCEYSFAPLYQIYTYRFDNVPAYVPPGHGMVYLTAVALARSALFERYGALIARVTLVIGASWALWGVTYAERADTGGAVLFLVFCGFFFVGRSPLLYIAAFYITSYLEIVGTYSGTWAWAMNWPSWDHLPQANPPSGIAAGYCFLDTIALFGAPIVARFITYCGTAFRRLQAVPMRVIQAPSARESS